MVAIGVCLVLAGTTQAQVPDLFPTDAQMQTAFGTVYNHLGLMEYCAGKGYAKESDVANSRKQVAAIMAHNVADATARSKEQLGAQGLIVGKQMIGLMDLDSKNPAHPEIVAEGKVMSLADNARAQRTTEQVLCRQMAEQAAPPP